jgi:signal-transduction protein with cAMP-binding, CBS, and nucleotidyltransferase domain
MVKGGFRHLVVVEDHDVAGLLSMRDIVRCWTSAEAVQETSPQPAATSA